MRREDDIGCCGRVSSASSLHFAFCTLHFALCTLLQCPMQRAKTSHPATASIATGYSFLTRDFGFCFCFFLSFFSLNFTSVLANWLEKVRVAVNAFASKCRSRNISPPLLPRRLLFVLVLHILYSYSTYLRDKINTLATHALKRNEELYS